MTLEQRQRQLAIWLRQQRNSKNMSMREVAEIIKKPHSFIGKIETCERRLATHEFIDYCDKLGFDPIAGLRVAL
jgi:hypothetical protein